MKSVLVTGGAGYKGCILVPKLLKAGYAVVVYDLMLFGADGLPTHANLQVVKGDIRNIDDFSRALAGASAERGRRRVAAAAGNVEADPRETGQMSVLSVFPSEER